MCGNVDVGMDGLDVEEAGQLKGVSLMRRWGVYYGAVCKEHARADGTLLDRKVGGVGERDA